MSGAPATSHDSVRRLAKNASRLRTAAHALAKRRLRPATRGEDKSPHSGAIRAHRLIDLRPAHLARQIEQLARLQRQAQNAVLVHRSGKLHPSRRQARKSDLGVIGLVAHQQDAAPRALAAPPRSPPASRRCRCRGRAGRLAPPADPAAIPHGRRPGSARSAPSRAGCSVLHRDKGQGRDRLHAFAQADRRIWRSGRAQSFPHSAPRLGPASSGVSRRICQAVADHIHAISLTAAAQKGKLPVAARAWPPPGAARRRDFCNGSITPGCVTSAADIGNSCNSHRIAGSAARQSRHQGIEERMSGAGFENLKALIVEDNAHMRSLLRALLNSVGIKDVAEASQWPGRHRAAARTQVRPGADRPGDEADGRAGIHPPCPQQRTQPQSLCADHHDHRPYRETPGGSGARCRRHRIPRQADHRRTTCSRASPRSWSARAPLCAATAISAPTAAATSIDDYAGPWRRKEDFQDMEVR